MSSRWHFFLADLNHILERYGNRGYRAVQLEAGGDRKGFLMVVHAVLTPIGGLFVSEHTTTQRVLFPGIFDRPVVAQFDQPQSSSDGGAISQQATEPDTFFQESSRGFGNRISWMASQHQVFRTVQQCSDIPGAIYELSPRNSQSPDTILK